MAWPASLPGRLLEAVGNGGPRGMVAHDRTRLIGGLPTIDTAQDSGLAEWMLMKCRNSMQRNC